MSNIKDGLLAELDRRVADKILLQTNAELLKKLISNAETDNEAMMIAELGTIYKKTGLHFDPRLEIMTNDIRYFKKSEALSFHTDDTKPTHKLIIGDNYEALQNLLIQYKGKIDVIYIDPPYGKDSMGEFAQTNYENAITRDNLLSMLYPRLILAKQLLSDRGVIYCSIDDKNQAYLKCLFDEVFGEKNFIVCFPKKGTGGKQDSTHYAIIHEYLICYAKQVENFVAGEIDIENKKYRFYDAAKKLRYNTQLLRKWGDSARRKDRPNCYYPIYYNENSNTFSLEKGTDTIEIYPMLDENVEGRWRWQKSTMQEGFDEGIVEIQKKNDEYIPMERLYESQDADTKLYSSWIDDIDASTGTKLVKKIFSEDMFSYPKATDYIFKILEMSGCKDDAIILDFFAGSGTTAHAVLDLNERDGSKRQFILCQLNENLDESLKHAGTSSKAVIENQIDLCEKYGRPHELSEITAERIRRIMTGKSYDGSNNFEWVKNNIPYGGNLDVYEIGSVADCELTEGKTPFDVIDETLYGCKKFESLQEKIEWVCQNFNNAQRIVEQDSEWLKRISK